MPYEKDMTSYCCRKAIWPPNERRQYNLQNSPDKKQADKTHLRHMLPLMEKEGWLRGWSQGSRRKSWNQIEFSQLDLSGAWYWQHFFFSLSPFLNRNFYNCYPMPVPPFYFGSGNSFNEFHRFKMQGSMSRGTQAAPRSRKRQENGFSLRASRRNKALLIPWFSPAGPISDFWPPELW